MRVIDFFRPPKFDFESALEKHRLQDKHRFLKKQQMLQAYMATTDETDLEESSSKSPNEVIDKNGGTGEFRDSSPEVLNISQFVDDYVYENSGEMTDEDYY